MKKLLLIAFNTYKQGIRKKFFMVLVLLSLFFICFSLLLGQVSLDEKARLTINFGLASIQLVLCALAVFLGSSLLSGDLNQKKIWTILSRPVSPTFFFLGRYLGLAFLIATGCLFLSFTLFGFFLYLNIPIQWVGVYALMGFLWESLLLLAFVFLFSSFSQSFFVPFYCFGLFIIGHFLDSFSFLVEKGGLSFLSYFSYFFPNLEIVNWKSSVVYGDFVSFFEFASSSSYILCWLAFALTLSFVFFEKRDFL